MELTRKVDTEDNEFKVSEKEDQLKAWEQVMLENTEEKKRKMFNKYEPL